MPTFHRSRVLVLQQDGGLAYEMLLYEPPSGCNLRGIKEAPLQSGRSEEMGINDLIGPTNLQNGYLPLTLIVA